MKLTKSLLLKIIREEMENQMGQGEPFTELLNLLVSAADGSPTHAVDFDPEQLKKEVEMLYKIEDGKVYVTDFGKKIVAALFPEESEGFLEPSETERNFMKKAKGEPYQPSMFESRKRR
jgi:hypothetical protein